MLFNGHVDHRKGVNPILVGGNMPSARKKRYIAYIASKKWKQVRQERLIIDLFRCQICDSSTSLHVHHVRYPKVYGEEEMADLVTLCSLCHERHHSIKEKLENGVKWDSLNLKIPRHF